METITLRPCTREDEELLRMITRQTMHDYVVQTYGSWDENFQEEYFRKRFDPDKVQVIQFEGKDVGRLCVVRETDEFFLEYIEILPDYQGKGIGSFLVGQILIKAKTDGIPVRLQVFKVNPARNLYERMGFKQIEETNTHIIMRAGV